MTVQVIILKNNDAIISELEERDDIPDCVLINPKVICKNYVYDERDHIPEKSLEFGEELFSHSKSAAVYLTLDNFSDYTYQKQILIRSDDIFTIVEPREDLLKFYREMVG
jgi:hypothetical protein